MSNQKVEVGISLPQYYADLDSYRKAWIAADELGADHIFVADHFFPQILTDEVVGGGVPPQADYAGGNFEATSLQAAMAATTSYAKIGCMVHANSYRNPNLLADIARTIDHISNGRFVLGIGAGYFAPDYIEYGYALGTAKSRALDLKRDVPIIRERLEKLTPPPLGKLPIMIASMGKKIGMPLVAEHADIWHIYGELEPITEKIAVMRELLDEQGRDHHELKVATNYVPHGIETGDPDSYLKIGITNISVNVVAPDWDLGMLRELIQWRDNLGD